MPSLRASSTAFFSFFGSTTNSAGGKGLHILDAAEVLFQIVHFLLERGDLLLGQKVERAVLRHLFEVVELLDALLDRLEVGQHAAEPAHIDVEHLSLLRFLADGLLRLLLRADEQDRAAVHHDVADEHIGFLHLFDRLLQVDDVDAVALGEDVFGHLRVPSSRLVAEVNAGLEKLLHGDNCHGVSFSFRVAPPPHWNFAAPYPARFFAPHPRAAMRCVYCRAAAAQTRTSVL